MIDFGRVTFVKSAPTVKDKPGATLPEIVFVGRSNVGKSSLINALTGHVVAKVSSKPGKTVLLNYYNVDDKFYLVDAPGYGYTISGTRHVESFAAMMEDYFADNQSLKGVVFLIDARHAPSKDDCAFHEFLINRRLPYLVVYTKADKSNQKERAAFKSALEASNFARVPGIATSTVDRTGFDTLKARLGALLK
ncbi:MAG: ribosome biogenesis GTP-binding protein YihA/YsxC [Bacilli bacterium]|jgi:GTP-binding protein